MIHTLYRIIEWRGTSYSTRFDDGPESISEALPNRPDQHSIGIKHIQPRRLQQNAYIEP